MFLSEKKIMTYQKVNIQYHKNKICLFKMLFQNINK